MSWKIKPSRRDSAPTLLVTVGAESFPAVARDGHGGTPHVLGQTHICVRRRTRRGWQPFTEHPCLTSGQAWDVLDGLGTSGRRVYVVAGVASDLLTMLDWWGRVERGLYTLRRGSPLADAVATPDGKPTRIRMHPLVMAGRPDVIGYGCGGSSFKWVSVTNWAECSLHDMAEQVKYELPALESGLDKWAYSVYPAADQARVMMLYVSRLMIWWLANGCGTWRDTPGAAAWSSWLRRTQPDSVRPHNDPDASRLEDNAVFGGRASAFYLGSVGDVERWGELADAPRPSSFGLGLSGPLHRFDVRAMYPSLLRDHLFPARLLRVDRRCSPRGLKAGMRSLLAVARVRLTTPAALYPKRIGREAVYPTGTFDTCLTTPELSQAIGLGHLRAVWEVAWYTPGRPFRTWAEWVLNLRATPEVANCPVSKTVVKTLANSFGGTMARRKMGWEDRPRMVPVKWWGPWWSHDSRTGEGVQYRGLAGRVQQMVRADRRPPTFAACFAFLTAHGRVQMNAVREVAGRREVIWQDTDGVMVTDIGRERLERSEHVGTGQFGKLQYEKTFHNVRLITPKHYWADGRWVLAGISDGFDATDGEHAFHVVTTNPARSAVEPTASAVYRAVERVDLESIEPGLSIDHWGWAAPPKMEKGETPEGVSKGQLKLWPDA